MTGVDFKSRRWFGTGLIDYERTPTLDALLSQDILQWDPCDVVALPNLEVVRSELRAVAELLGLPFDVEVLRFWQQGYLN